ncbi:hypothetical protein FJ651_02250 [Paucihalobacter ruber]|uniref:Sulfotransferase family protein n=1 Tax=Paucihalobacter ruber TaxID=2567861 RepID=A0A506PQB5_9FLAO|nr:sulfotransferase family 2 domain-containing protein [Paucihalobacter ruber]TPV35758.1 hypothetical protein FJ651_02250 [Paucihalobacter ruber]
MYYILHKKKNLHFLHIGKTGGTAIKHALTKNCDVKHIKIHLHNHKFKLTAVPEGHLCFFAVRNPIDRFISGFYSRQRKGQPKYYSEWSASEAIAFQIFHTPNELARDLYSDNSQKRINAEFAMYSIEHVRSSYWDWFINEEYLLQRKQSIGFVFQQGQLVDDFEEFKRKFKLPVNLHLPDKNTVEAHANDITLDKNLEQQSIDNLTQWYQDEFKFLNIIKTIVK